MTARRERLAAGAFDPHCTRCPRLARHLLSVRRAHPDYHARPVAPFGDPRARIVLVGLAPGMHGANRTGRPFTGDFAGILLYETLHALGLSNQSESVAANDGLRLKGCRITNAVKCLPPANKPTPAEIKTCNDYLRHELAALKPGTVLVALGTIAHQAILRAFALPLKGHLFKHGARHQLPNGLVLLDSYHCSRYNTQTRRLTAVMFRSVLRQAKRLAKL
jgi:uracil-DNA glycosylase family 4